MSRRDGVREMEKKTKGRGSEVTEGRKGKEIESKNRMERSHLNLPVIS